MQKKTELQELLRDFRDLTDAQLCSVASNRGTRVFVGRPTTLSAEDLAGGSGAEAKAPDSASPRRLTKNIVGYVVTAEFESEEASKRARGSFEELIGIIEEMVSNELELESPRKPPNE